MLPRLAGCVCSAIKNCHLRLRHVHQSCVIEQYRDADELAEWALARCQMIHRQHRMRLATTKGRLQLDDRLPAFTIKPLRYLSQQAPHPFRDESAFVKRLRVSVFHGCLA